MNSVTARRRTGADLVFKSGGNPPEVAGLFTEDGVRVAWWPVGYQPTHENIEAVWLNLILTREDNEPVSRIAVRDFLASPKSEWRGSRPHA